MENNAESPIFRWMKANEGTPDFASRVARLLGFACAEWIRRETFVPVNSEEALSRLLCASVEEAPLAKWLDAPEKFTDEIAAFCETSKSLPLPDCLKGEIPDVLDLRGVKCPLCAARSRLVMSGYPAEKTLYIYIDEGSPIENVPGALIADGQNVLFREKKGDYWVLSVVKPVSNE